MINITNKSQCTGCTACQQVCGHKAIGMHFDGYGHSYPVVDTNLCTNCGLCEKVCPMLHKDKIPTDTNLNKLKVYAVYNKDAEVRSKSTSGGVFSVLSKRILEMGGVVYAARFDEKYHILHDSFSSYDKIAPFRGSKYAQSDLGDTFKSIKKELKDKPVLFVGTPCQIAGLKSYLLMDYDNLYTCDFICMGISSPVIWEKYLHEKWANYTINKIFFKDKRDGWHNWKMLINYNNNKEYLVKGGDDPFFYGYLSHLTYRASCFECPFRTCERISDFTIADCWGIDKVHPEFDDNKGCTTLILQSEKAQVLFDDIKCSLNWEEYDIEDVKKYNPYVVYKIQPHPKREEFYQRYKNDGYLKSTSIYMENKRTICHKIKCKLKSILKL